MTKKYALSLFYDQAEKTVFIIRRLNARGGNGAVMNAKTKDE